MAAALVGADMIPVAHVEAGLRADRTMPEEINRLVTGSRVRPVFTPSGRQRAPPARCAAGVFLVGNIAIDTLFQHLPMASGPCNRVAVTEKRCRAHVAPAVQRGPAGAFRGILDSVGDCS
jgi:UDP-N-acetylglucosamine 2-epimerase